MKTYLACYARFLHSGRPPVSIPIHVHSWLFPAFFARRAARKYARRRSWILVHLKPLP